MVAVNRYHFDRLGRGPLKLWEHPEPGMKYTLGADAATGVGRDWTAFSVLKNTVPLIQVASYRAKINTVDATRDMCYLGWFYNTALIVPEINYPGNALCDGALTTFNYPNLYRSEDRMDSDPGVSDKFGMRTTQASKWLLIRETQKAIEDGHLILNDPQTIEEFCNFVYIEDKSKTGASEGMNDDTVIATMMAVHGALLYPVRFQQVSHGPQLSRSEENKQQSQRIIQKYFDDCRKPVKKSRRFGMNYARL
jgi:hypothetical protein